MRAALPATTLAAVAIAAQAQAATFDTLTGEPPLVIAHRGAPGYLPEHTLAGYELGAIMGADYVEPDLVITADGVAIALHDLSLERTTDVADLFAPRNDGYLASDFTLAEIKTLTVQPTGTGSFSHPGFTPSAPAPFEVPTFEEVLDFVTGYNAANGTDVGVYPEVKAGSDALERLTVEQLRAAGFDGPDDRAYVQSFDYAALLDVAAIQADLGTDVDLVALGGALEVEGVFGMIMAPFDAAAFVPLTELASVVEGLGPSRNSSGLTAGFVDEAHALGLQVHAFTFREQTAGEMTAALRPLVDIGLDGFFTDYPDVGVAAVARLAPVPLPAAGLTLLAGLAVLGGLRRR